MAQWLMNPTRNHKVAIQSLGLLSRLRNRHCCELWCRSKMQLGSHVAAALVYAGGYSSDSTSSLGTSIFHGSSPRKGKKTKQNETKKQKDQEYFPQTHAQSWHL